MKLIKSTMSRKQIVERFELLLPLSIILGVTLGFCVAIIILK